MPWRERHRAHAGVVLDHAPELADAVLSLSATVAQPVARHVENGGEIALVSANG